MFFKFLNKEIQNQKALIFILSPKVYIEYCKIQH